MILVLDIGNTNIKAGIYEGENLPPPGVYRQI